MNTTFDRALYADDRGDVVAIGVQLDGVERAVVTVDGPDGGANYTATVTATDVDGDGRIALRFNTYDPGTDGDGTFVAVGPDRVVVNATAAHPGPLPSGSYDLTVRAAGDDGDGPDDLARLRLTERATESLAAWMAFRGDAANLSSMADLRRAVGHGTVRRSASLGRSDVLVLRLQASGLSGPLARQPGPNATARFFGLLGTETVELTMRQDPATVNTEQEPVRFDPRSTTATTVLADPGNDTYYLVVDVDRLPTVESGHVQDVPDPGDRYDVAFSVANDSRLAGNASDRVTTTFEIVRWRASVVEYDRLLRVPPEDDVAVSGETNLPPGAVLSVAIDGEDGLLASREATVTDAGRFRARFDFGGVDQGTAFAVHVRFRGAELEGSPDHGVVDRVEASVRGVEVERDGLVIIRVEATLDTGGFVVVHANGTDGPTVGRSSYIEPGAGRTVEVVISRFLRPGTRLVADLHRDVDGDRAFSTHAGDHPYAIAGEPVATVVGTVPASTTPSPPATSTPGTTPGTTGSIGPTTTAATDSTPSERATTPGFAVPVALLAGLVALLVVARRRDPR